ncbi:hypothetical protein GOV12_04180 [Candidatus Pacearchaeota archaeon]|nr:hypothetical protein [Candidatus Pacearchaeota archaeon]
MKQELKCPLCKEYVYSEAGIGCLLCGMPLKDDEEEFCSKICKITYEQINNNEMRKLK